MSYFNIYSVKNDKQLVNFIVNPPTLPVYKTIAPNENKTEKQ